MKQKVLNAVIILVLIMTSCGVGKVKNDADQALLTIERKWQLIELGGKPVVKGDDGRVFTLTFSAADKRYAAVTDCNGVGGNYELRANNAIKFSAGMSTQMFCDVMTIENGMKDLLDRVDNYTINKGILTLSAKKESLAKFKVGEEEHVLSGDWQLDYISGGRIAFEGLYPNAKPTITFEQSNGKVFGHTGCNRYSGDVFLDGNAINFGSLAGTKMACEGEGESIFLKSLAKVDKYSVQENTLTFIMGDIAIMRFQKK